VTTCRLIVDPPGSGAWNMAVDEMLLEWAGATAGCCLRFYGWERPTLSLGYFQAYDDRRRHAPSLPCPVVRRASGGGAIVHDRELTYSLVLPRSHPLARERLSLYRTVHRALIAALSGFGVEASLCKASVASLPAPPFLCFQRRAPGDVLVGEVKVAGSAQRRSADAVLQHGSVLLARSVAAPELEGLDTLVGGPVDGHDLLEAWLDRLARALSLRWRRAPLDESERRRAAALVESKYACDAWNVTRGRGPRQNARVRPPARTMNDRR